MDIEKCKDEFAKREIMWLVFQGALSMGYPVYKQNHGVTPEDRVIFKQYLSERLEEYAKHVNRSLNDKEYIKILEKFENDIRNYKHKEILKYDGLTFGRVQKLLNLYLKYLWVFNQPQSIDPPPHCPIDSTILGKIDWPYPDIKWTMPIFTVQKYQEAIDLCRKKTKDDIAGWELQMFNNR